MVSAMRLCSLSFLIQANFYLWTWPPRLFLQHFSYFFESDAFSPLLVLHCLSSAVRLFAEFCDLSPVLVLSKCARLHVVPYRLQIRKTQWLWNKYLKYPLVGLWSGLVILVTVSPSPPRLLLSTLCLNFAFIPSYLGEKWTNKPCN